LLWSETEWAIRSMSAHSIAFNGVGALVQY
jgi:hypothetical protein